MLDYRVEWLEVWNCNGFQHHLPWDERYRVEATRSKTPKELEWEDLRLVLGRCVGFNSEGILAVSDNGIFRVLGSGVAHAIPSRDIA